MAECALKCLIQQTQTKMSPKAFSHELSQLAGEGLELALLVSPFHRRYGAGLSMNQAWQQWDPGQRYQPDEFLPEVELRKMQTHAATLGVALLTDMILDGVLEASDDSF